ncbi:MAG: DUF3108 domain-containing protein [Gemmatimonadetes bacterium]|nr:DUF3108 domain-containing protein [Gemmatimonadota bacterium]
MRYGATASLARWKQRRPSARITLGLAACLTLLFASTLEAQTNRAALPFSPGEELVYRVRLGGLGSIGRAVMGVDGPEVVRGREVYVLRFDFRGRVGPVVVVDRTRSWVDPAEMAALRFSKYERSPVSTNRQDVELFPGQREWKAASGEGGRLATGAPLDELSFLYHIRELRLADGDVYSCVRHFDEARNPVTVRVLQRGRIRVPAGEFATVLVEMRVKDPRRYGSEGVIRLHLTDDARRIPVRIESTIPVAGSTTLDLESASGPRVALRQPSG